MGKVRAEKHKNRVWLTGTRPADAPLAKSIPGKSPNYKNGSFSHWSFPLTWNTCLELRRRFRDRLEIGPELNTWARHEKTTRNRALAVAKMTEVPLARLAEGAPKLAAAMADRTYQQVGAAYINVVRNCIIGDDPGLGKTLQVMGAVVEAGLVGPILVLAPTAAVQITWPTELSTWLPDDAVYVCVGNRPQREKVLARFVAGCRKYPKKRHWLIANFEMVRAHTGRPRPTKICPEEGPFEWSHTNKVTGKVEHGFWMHPYADLFCGDFSAIIADESQRALITKTSERVDQTQVRAGIGLLRVKPGGMKIAVTGTPFRGKKENLWGTLNWLWPERYTSYWAWIMTYFETYQDQHSLVIGELDESKEAQFYEDLDTVMIRRRKSEVVPDLPPKQYPGWPLDPDDPGSMHGIWLDMLPEQRKFYREMVKAAETKMESGTLMANGVLAEMTRLKQFTTVCGDVETRTRKAKKWIEAIQDFVYFDEQYQVLLPRFPSNKFNWLVDWLDERGILTGEGGGKVVIASQFTSVINMFRQELLDEYGCESLIISGETKHKDRKDNKEKFQAEGGPQIFFLNIDAGGVSLTLDAADDLIFLDQKWIPDDQTQVEDRIHRVSRMHQCNIWYVLSRGSIEETIARKNEERDDMQLRILDGRRGVDYAKKFLEI